jgi:hypothetical protein
LSARRNSKRSRTPVAFAVLGTIAATLVACTSERPPPLLDIGDPCRGPDAFCIDDLSQQTCIDDEWVALDCDDVCAATGPYVATGCTSECVCELADPAGCSPGATECLDDGTIGVCTQMQKVAIVDCAQLCAGMGAFSLGCVSAEGAISSCWCTTEGTACDNDGETACVDATTLARCEMGTWQYADCEQSCASGGTCDPWTVPAGCQCG